MFPVTPKLPVAPVPVVTMFCEPKLGDTLVPAMAADALTSALTIDPSTIFAELTIESFKSDCLTN